MKAAGAGLGHQSLMKDVGIDLPVSVWTDSSAALGIASRSGLGKLRHLETHTLWVQEKVRVGAISVRKVTGEVNPADLFTKHLPSKDKVHQLLALFRCEYREGRATTAPLLRPHGSEAVDPLPTFVTTFEGDLDGELHDVGRLPHLHSAEEIIKRFPLITAAPLQPNAEDWEPPPEDNDISLKSRGEKKMPGAREVSGRRIQKLPSGSKCRCEICNAI